MTAPASPALVGLALAAAGGAAYLWWKAKQAQSASTTQNFCNGMCGTTDTVCQTGCNLGGDVLGWIAQGLDDVNPITNSQQTWDTQVANDIASNAKLNGPIAIPIPWGIDSRTPESAITGDTLVYANGCMPFFDAPGWGKCATGTVDMYASAVVARAGGAGDYSQDAASEAALVTTPASTVPTAFGYVNDGQVAVQPIDKNNFMTGLIGDPTTAGPFGAPGSGYEMYQVQTYDGTNPEASELEHPLLEQWTGNTCFADPNGSHVDPKTGAKESCPDETSIGPFTWYTRGVRLTCPTGQVPKTLALAALGIPNPDPLGTETCVANNSVTVACAGTNAPPGFTWSTADGAGHWVRATQGQTIDNGPCAPVAVNTITKSNVESVGVVLGLDQGLDTTFQGAVTA